MSSGLPFTSVARWWDPFTTAAVAFIAFFAAEGSVNSAPALAAILVGAVTAWQALLELCYAPWRKTPVPRVPAGTLMRRVGIKWLGVTLYLAAVVFAWALFTNYKSTYFKPFFATMTYAVPAYVLLAAAFVFYTEWRLGPEEDVYWHSGNLLLGHWKVVDWGKIRDGALATLVKGFFFPLNFTSLIAFTKDARRLATTFHTWHDWQIWIDNLDKILYITLIVAIIPGYFFSSRLLGTAIRKVETSWMGWMVTLACYDPLHLATRNLLGFNGVKSPEWHSSWAYFLHDIPVLYIMAGAAVLAFEFVHFWGESILGIRSSNLTHRGIITNGPYRYCKHPVYASKCLRWLLVFMPFAAGHTVWEDMRCTILFLISGTIFYMRGWVEERMLATDPNYVAYALWVDEHGIFSWIGRICPVAKFSWRLARWKRNGSLAPS